MYSCRLTYALSGNQKEITDWTNNKNLESTPVVINNNAIFNTVSRDGQSSVSDNMDIVNYNSKVADKNIESEPVVQETDKRVDVNQLDINEWKRSVRQLSIERSWWNLWQTYTSIWWYCFIS